MGMERRRLGDSDLEVSTIALGSWLTYSGGIGREQTEACTRAAFDAGITLFDTANVYGQGAAETAWGEILADYPRDSYVLATKAYFPMSARDRGLSRAQIHKQLDGSLARLRTDYVDLFQCHRYDDDTPLEETMAALTEVVAAGKTRWIGFSEWPADRIEAALELPGVTKFVSSQPQYSALWRKPEADVIPVCAAHGISQIVWSPLAQGVLTGKYLPGEKVPLDSRAASPAMSRFIRQWLKKPTLEAVQRLRPVAAEAGVTMSQLALAWVLHQNNVTATIVGATRPEQVHENAAAAAVRLSPDTLRAIDAALARAAIA
jgi:aryl-alcohol dehydrogenase-like predicted oxidoreductase